MSREHNPPGDGHELFTPATLTDPYPAYHRLRTADAVHWDDHLGVWILTGYAEVSAALRDARLTSERLGSIEQLEQMGLEEVIPIFRIISNDVSSLL